MAASGALKERIQLLQAAQARAAATGRELKDDIAKELESYRAQGLLGANTGGASGSGAKPTEAQSKAVGFLTRALGANEQFEKENVAPRGVIAQGFADVLPASVTNSFTSNERQVSENAMRDFVTATLRQESGAAISAGEYDNQYKTFFPQPGDGPDVIASKEAARRRALDGLIAAAGPVVSDGLKKQYAEYFPTDANPVPGTLAGGGDGQGGNPPPTGGDTPPTDPTAPFNPYGGDKAAGEAQRVLSTDGQGKVLTAQDKSLAAEAQALMNDRRSTRAEFDALAKKYGRDPFGPELDTALDGRAKSGNTPIVEAVPSGVQESTFAPGGVAEDAGAFSAAATDAGSFGLFPKAVAGVQAVSDRLNATDNRPVGEIYGDKLADVRGRMDAGRDANPFPSFAGDVAGVVAGQALLGRIPGVGAIGGRISNPVARGVLGDAGYGATYNAGSADSLADVPGAALKGALVAGAGGGIGRVGAIPAAAAFRPLGRLGTRAFNALGGSADLPAEALAKPDRMLLGAARKGDIGATTTRLSEAESLGVPMSLADASPDLTSLAGSAVRRSPTAADVAQNAFLPRSRGQIDRLTGAVERDLGPVGSVPQISADLTDQARAAAGPLYDAAYAAPGAGAVHPQIEGMLNRPSMRAALGRAQRIAAEEGRDPNALGFDLTPEGEVTLKQVPSWETLDYVKRGLDDVIDGYRDKTTGKVVLDTEGRAINGTRKEFLNIVDKANPDYAKARAAYAGPVQARDAMAAGEDAFRSNPQQLAVDTAGASPERMAQMQLGYRGALLDAGNRARFSSNPFDATLGTPAAEQRLGVLYGDTPGTRRLLQTRDAERGLAGSSNAILGNSLTAQRVIADQAFENGILGTTADLALHSAAGGVPGFAVGAGKAVLRGGLKNAFSRGAVRNADAMAARLFDTNPRAARSTLGDLLMRDENFRVLVDNYRRRAAYGTAPLGVSAGILALPNEAP